MASAGYEVVNVGSGRLETEADLLEAVRRVIPEARFAPSSEEAAASASRRRAQPLDVRRARALLGYEPAYTLAEAVADYVAIIREAT